MEDCSKCNRTDIKCCHTCKKDAEKCNVLHNCGSDCPEHEEKAITNADKEAWETVYQNVLRLQEEYRGCGDVRNVYECIKLQEMLLEYKEQLTEEI